jgi:RHS repeat-associated protein
VPPSGQVWRSYYYAGAQLIAMRVLTGTTGNTLYYLHSDHLGSTSVTTSDTGAVLARQWYHPFGTVRASSGALPTDITFTGQRSESGLGSLMYFRARFYSPLIGRFLSADSIVPGAGNPQSLNRYSFVYNNPVKYVDPSGHFPWLLVIVAVIASAILTSDTAAPSPPPPLSVAAVDNIAATAPTSADALITMFTTDALSGDTPQARFDTILEGTGSSAGQYFRGDFGDTGFQAELQDGGDQVGHFVQGAALAYKSDNPVGEYGALSLIVGHEIVGDAGGPSGVYRTGNNLRQFAAGATHLEAHDWFLEGTDTSLNNIYNLGDPSGNRTGNSMQDLRLSYRAWIFGKMLREGAFATRADAALWLEENIADPNR